MNDNDREDEGFYSLRIPINPSRSDARQLASEAVDIFGGSKLHRHLLGAMEKACNRKDRNPDKIYMPLEIMTTYCTVLLDTSMDKIVDERFVLEVALGKYNDNNPTRPFTKEDFKLTKYDRSGNIAALKECVEKHPLVFTMKQLGVWKNPKIRALSEMITHIKNCTKTYHALEDSMKEALEMKKKALKGEVDMINLKAHYNELTEPERKAAVIQTCKQYGMTQAEVSSYTGIGIATVKRRWNDTRLS